MNNKNLMFYFKVIFGFWSSVSMAILFVRSLDKIFLREHLYTVINICFLNNQELFIDFKGQHDLFTNMII